MKLNKNSLINVVESPEYIKHHSDYVTSRYEKKDGEIIKSSVNWILGNKLHFFQFTDRRRLVFSGKTKENVFGNYFVPKNIRYDVLKTLPNRHDSILIDEKTLLRYTKVDGLIICCIDRVKEFDRLYNYMFFVDLQNDRLFRDDMNKVSDDEFIEEYFSMFMLVVTYLELTPVTLEVLESNRSTNQSKKEGKIKNEGKKVIIVKTNWNVEKLDLRDIHVRGHWRLQPCGVGRSQYKYVFVKPYEKGITRRLPQKELV